MKVPSSALVAAAAVLGLAACSSSSPVATRATPTGPSVAPAPALLNIGVGDTAITAPDSVPAGFTKVVVTAAGSTRAHIALELLAPGVTFDHVEKATSQEQDKLATIIGGNGSVNPGLSTTVYFDLPAGNYEIVQLTQADGHSPTHRLVATATSGTPARAPAARGNIVLKGDVIALASGFDGQGTWQVTNTDAKDDHEATLLKIAPGKTVRDIVSYFKSSTRQGRPPMTAMGGMGDLRSGRSGYMTVQLSPGSYALACFAPDQNGIPHVAMGMITGFQVA